MALDRSWYNALVDDDGSGLTGSVWDKADVDALMDAIDAEIARVDSAITLPSPYVSVMRAVPQAFTSGSYQALTFDLVQANEFAMWTAADPARIYIHKSGVWLVTACVFWASNTNGTRGFKILKNNGIELGVELLADANVTNSTPMLGTHVVNLAAGESIYLVAYQGSGGTLNAGGLAIPNATNYFRAHWLFG